MITLLDPHTIEVLQVLSDLFINWDTVKTTVGFQQLTLGITTTLYKSRIERHHIAKANDDVIGKDNACRSLVLYAIAATTPGVGVLVLGYQLTTYSDLLGGWSVTQNAQLDYRSVGFETT